MSKPNNIAKARASLIVDQPFFASILLPMPITEDSSIPTFATDGESIVYNPEWAAKKTLAETVFVMAHETMHCVFDHMGRRGSKTPNRWNQAADYIINELLVKEKIGSMPPEGLYNPSLVQRGGGTAEGVYKLLPESSEDKKPGDKGGALDQVHDAGTKNGQQKTDPATMAQKSSALKIRVIQAKNAAKMQGKLPGSLEKLVEELITPEVDWREVLRRFISERAKVEYSFSRPKRRFLGEDLYLPSLTGEKMGSLVIAVDCSGSVDEKLLNRFAAEINAIKQDVHPSAIDVLYFDTRVFDEQRFEADDEIKLNIHRGGGTAFSPVFERINKMPELPVACVFLTDLVCHDFGPAPEYPVLWTVLDGPHKGYDNPPFGEVLNVSKGDFDE